jgi:hypothetical protein
VLPWLEGSVQGVTHVGVFTMTTGTALALYLLSVFTDPGRCEQRSRCRAATRLKRAAAVQRAAQLAARRGDGGLCRSEEEGVHTHTHTHAVVPRTLPS